MQQKNAPCQMARGVFSLLAPGYVPDQSRETAVPETVTISMPLSLPSTS